jgi:hypothetical protein
VELKAFEDVAHSRRERLNVRSEVLADIVLIAHQLLQVEFGGVVEELTGLLEQERLRIESSLLALC